MVALCERQRCRPFGRGRPPREAMVVDALQCVRTPAWSWSHCARSRGAVRFVMVALRERPWSWTHCSASVPSVLSWSRCARGRGAFAWSWSPSERGRGLGRTAVRPYPQFCHGRAVREAEVPSLGHGRPPREAMVLDALQCVRTPCLVMVALCERQRFRLLVHGRASREAAVVDAQQCVLTPCLVMVALCEKQRCLRLVMVALRERPWSWTHCSASVPSFLSWSRCARSRGAVRLVMVALRERPKLWTHSSASLPLA